MYKWYKGKSTKLYKKVVNSIEEKYETSYFNGKLYHDNKVYNLKTGKTKSFVAKQIRNSKKYLYYINKNGNLKRLDKQGNRETVDSKGKIEKIYLVNAGQTVIYSKGTGEKETFYRRTGLKKAVVKLVVAEELFAMFENQPTGEYIGKRIDSVVLHDYKVYFALELNRYNALVSVGVNGKNIKIHAEREAQGISIGKKNDKLCCTFMYVIDGDFNINEYEYLYF